MIPGPEMLSQLISVELAKIGCANCASTTRSTIGKPTFDGKAAIVKVKCVNCDRVTTLRLFGDKS